MVHAMASRVKPYISRSGMGAVTWLLLAVAVLAVLVAVAAPLRQLTEAGATVPVTLADPDSLRITTPAALPAGARLVGAEDGVVRLQVAALPVGLRLLAAASTSLLLLAIAIGSACLALVLRSIRAGEPFDRRNPSRLRVVAGALVLGSLGASVADTLAGDAVLSHLGLHPGDSPFTLVVLDLPLNPLLGAALLLAAAEAFRRGGALTAEVDGLV
jgi:Protein of unknown function (DUF2975)